MIITSGGALIVYCGSGVADANAVIASIYATDDYDAEAKGVLLKGYYLASQPNNMGVKYGTVLRREYSASDPS